MHAAILFLATLLTQGAPPLDEGLGTHHRKITTDSPLAQKYFDQGLRLLYSFNRDESRKSFAEAARLDPKSPMAWWGVAVSYGPDINITFVIPEWAKAATAAIHRAKALKMRGTPVERALIEAAYVRYTDPQPEDRSALDRLYATKMRAVWHRFPKDTDVGALFAESMMDLRPWDLWQKSGSPQPGTTEILATLDHVLAQNPKHPGAVHYLIHALEASPRAGDATRAADILRTLMPSAGHMVHMPSHIDVRTGQWGKAVIANEKAIVADAEYRKAHNKIGLYRVYMSHNYHMLSLAAMMLGQSKKAIGALDRMVAIIPPDFAQENAAFIDGFMAMPLEVRKRFGNWDEILSAPDFPDYFPIARSMRHMDRAIAYAAKGMPSEARAEQSLFFMARKKVPAEAFFGNNKASDILSVAAHLMNGEILVAEDRMDDACAELRVAVDAESALRYSEPPDWIIPTRHTLGAVLVKSERFDEAVEVYRADLKEYPNDGWALYGLSQALAGQGKHPEAARVRSRFDTMWANADVQISSSCMCLPGGNRRP